MFWENESRERNEVEQLDYFAGTPANVGNCNKMQLPADNS